MHGLISSELLEHLGRKNAPEVRDNRGGVN